MRRQIKLASMVAFIFFNFNSVSFSAEDWKGTPEPSEMSFGAVTGLGLVNGSASYALLGTASKKIIRHGFVPDINNSVSIEGEFGPMFRSNTAWAYSVHLRWDFEKDPLWTLFAMGGVGGNFMSVNSNTDFQMTPRFGVGAFWKVNNQIRLRGEVAHDLVGVGINFPI